MFGRKQINLMNEIAIKTKIDIVDIIITKQLKLDNFKQLFKVDAEYSFGKIFLREIHVHCYSG